MIKKVTSEQEFGMGYDDARRGVNGTGFSDSYDEGWIRGYQDLRDFAWERRYNDFSKQR